jgi:hypothetical protein
VGTAYGEVKNFMTDNQAPTAIDVSIAGTSEVNKLLTASYTYQDAEEDGESGSTYQWYRANDGLGAGLAPIAGATSLTYTIVEADQGKYIAFGVTPKASTGSTTGVEVKSTFFGAIGEATTVTFTYNNQEVTYGILNRPSGRKWLDRNLGAPGVATSIDNYQNYGDYFQWGRLADGHQLATHTSASEATAVNGSTTTLSTSTNPNTSLFITAVPSPFDWITPQDHTLWQGVNDTNNPCPEGWRVPTREEWAAENITNLNDGFNKLKLTFSGYRNAGTGLFLSMTLGGYYWSSTYDATMDPIRSIRIRFTNATDGTSYDPFAANRAAGYAVRCIKHQ